jgi:hypothetical protein
MANKEKKDKPFNILGRLIDRTTKNAGAGLRVEAWDKELRVKEVVGSAVADTQGVFRIEFEEPSFRKLFLDRKPQLFFKVFRDGLLLHSTESSVVWNEERGENEIVIEGDFKPDQPPANERREVKGTVLLADGSPAGALVVTAFNRNLREEREIGKGQTDLQGFYQILYTKDPSRKTDVDGVALEVKAFARNGSLLATSKPLFDAPTVAVVDLSIPSETQAPPSLFEKIASTLAPLLKDVKVQDLNEDAKQKDVSFLSARTGLDQAVLARFVLAHRLSQDRLPPEFWFALLRGSAFQFAENKSLDEQLAAFTDSVPALDRVVVRKSLALAFSQNETAKTLEGKTAEWIETFLKFAAQQSLSAPTFLKSALDHAGIKDARKQEKFAQLFSEHQALTPELLTALQNDKSFKQEEVADLHASFRLAELTQTDFSVVKAIKEEFGIRRPEEIRSLARKSEPEWISLVQTKLAAGEMKLPIELGQVAGLEKPSEAEVFGRTLERQFREAFPTTAFAAGLQRSLRNGGTRGLKHAEALGTFLERHEDFELLHTSVDDFLNRNTGPDFERENFRQELKAVQRVFKLAPTFAATDALLADGNHSAQQIYRLGKSQFVQRYGERAGLDAKSASAIWDKAADTHAAVLTIVADLKALDPNSLPMALQTGNKPAALAKSQQSGSQPLSSFPNWENLFQTGDLCDCEACRSVIGPAAYFADLLMYLKDRKAADMSSSVKDILFSRRPDLGYLELNCENALTTLPYIDVVNEVLEAAIATDENDVELIGLTNIPDASAATGTVVASALQQAKLDFGADFSLSQVDPLDLDRWVVHGDRWTYLLKKKMTANFFAEVLRNTKAKADELRANPQYVNPKTYEKLRQAKYPMALPFDLFAEEVRAAMRKSNLQRSDLMMTFRGKATPNNPSDGDIAAEYFGISVDPAAAFDEKHLIVVADPTIAGQQTVWGETGSSWLDVSGNVPDSLCIVKNFLRKTGLEYNQLLELLDLKFINPGDIVIQHLDPSCDTATKVIGPLDEAKLDRIHRFLRLWRKWQDWKMWEVDLVVRHPQIGNGAVDETFLIKLFYFSQLRNRLGKKATIENVCALFGDLNIETRFTKLHEPREDALYQQLFLNRRLINPLDPAFELDPLTGDLPAGQTISGHRPVVTAALGVRDSDLTVLTALKKASNGLNYITDDLTLGNLSFLGRHSWLSKLLKFKADDWKLILKLFHQDILSFSDPKSAWDFVQQIDQLKDSGFTPDELNWILAADRSTKAALKETDAARFLSTLRKDLNAIAVKYDPAQYDFLTANPASDVESLTSLLTTLLQQLNRDDATTQLFIASLRDEVSLASHVVGLPAAFDFPGKLKATIRIRYDEPAGTLHFTGLMTPAERATLLGHPTLSVVTSIPSYQDAIEELFNQPRRALRFFEPVFAAPLAKLPPAVDFTALEDPLLVQNISYNAEARLLSYAGFLSQAQKEALDVLSVEPAYRNAVDSLFTQPLSGVFPLEKIWLQDTDLLFPLRDLVVPTNDNLATNLALAVNKALAYLSTTQAGETVIQKCSAQLQLTPAVTRFLFTHFALLPATMLDHLTGAFAATTGVVEYDPLNPTIKDAFDSWYWANRVAKVLKKWRFTLAECERLVALPAAVKLLDFLTLPLVSTAGIAPIDRFLRTTRIIALRDSLPETAITLLEVLEKLGAGTYASVTAFAADVEQLNDAWLTADVVDLVNALDLAPVDYLLAESWERVLRAFNYLTTLNSNPNTVKTFAGPAMSDVHAATLKELLRSKFGSETWLTVSGEIQDILRGRKRDAMVAYLLTQPPATSPTHKWDNTNDLYAYYLLDVEMSSCQLTSRLVQGSGSVQLFVQRCFMGLEPDVEVKADGATGDSAWRWWKWMHKFQDWVANRKVFLWPENWVEPELKPDRSQFFKDLENELLQNEVNQTNVETAFSNYLEKLDGVAQLEIAGFYQEDDGDNAIVHVFGRTKGAEPHIYYYRRYDYRQWTPWEKVEVDIQGDYLIPAVVNRELFLFWPVFSEVPNEDGNSKVSTPSANQSNVNLQKTKKNLRLQMAVSEYRQGKWVPKRISTDSALSGVYEAELARKHYQFFPIDRNDVDGRFAIRFKGHSLDSKGTLLANLDGSFELAGCKGVPELANFPGFYGPALRPETNSTGALTSYQRWLELGPASVRGDKENDFALESYGLGRTVLAQVLIETPWIFKMTPAWHLSYFDKLRVDGLVGLGLDDNPESYTTVGSWLPFFYDDKKRTFFVLPSPPKAAVTTAAQERDGRSYYPEIKKMVRQLEDSFVGEVQEWLNGLELSALSRELRERMERSLQLQLREERNPPYSDAQIKGFLKKYLMRSVHWYLGTQAMNLFQYRQFHFKNFYHPFVCDFAKTVYNPLKGIPALMNRETQLQDSGFSFRQSYVPTPWVVNPPTEKYYPNEVVDFSPDGAYSSYNWELFFHAPLLIANALSKNQRFEEARDWYHFIFNPIGIESSMPGASAMSKFWITKPFFETTDPQYVQQRIDNILGMLAGNANPGLDSQVLDWRTHPFEPHRIANYRTVAYQKTAVMKYLDNLISWGDYLFRQDSMESINEATQLYVLAAELLGPRPKNIPPQAKPPLESFNELENQFDKFANALVEVENLVPPLAGNSNAGSGPPLPTLYFCIPHNEKMLGYWNTIADRLYKIRHCMNIEGVVRQLALFEPPIDPAALVKAVAGGVDISSALADLNASLPIYHFNVYVQKATEVLNDVKALGGALLSALEKKDAEALALLRQEQEIKLLDAVKAVREQQIKEAKENLEGVKRSKVTIETRRNYYRDIEPLSTPERLHLDKLHESHIKQEIAQGVKLVASVLSYLPDIDLGASGFGGTPLAKFKIGGLNLGQAVGVAGDVIALLGQIAANDSIMASSKASFDRRLDDWKLQERLAEKELDQIDKQISAAELRVAIAEKELENHQIQIDNAKAIDNFMRSKYTNLELYQWQVGEISNVYFQSYKLAYDLAKRAERCFRLELGLQDSSYINFGYWDSLKKGLLSGEKLQYDLRRLETAYLDQNRREFELTKHISLALLDPLALIRLRETGRCFFHVPEEIFDLDYPGHFFRRIKSVSLTLPCVTGPYTTLSCTLRLLKSEIRITSDIPHVYAHNSDGDLPADDPRFIENNIPVKAIAASSAQNDSGLFELNFRDDRYLPFEGAGAISAWTLELFTDPSQADFGRRLRQFDYSTISDAVMHVKYTAREDAGPFKSKAIDNLHTYFSQNGNTTPTLRLLDLKQEFPSQWHRFVNPANPTGPNTFEFEMSPSLFQLKDMDQALKINTIWFLARCKNAQAYEIMLTLPEAGPWTFSLPEVNQYGGLHVGQKDALELLVVPTDPPVLWQLKMTPPLGANLQDNEVENLIMVLGYQSSA